MALLPPGFRRPESEGESTGSSSLTPPDITGIMKPPLPNGGGSPSPASGAAGSPARGDEGGDSQDVPPGQSSQSATTSDPFAGFPGVHPALQTEQPTRLGSDAGTPAAGVPRAMGSTGGPAVPAPGPASDRKADEPEPFTFSDPDPPERRGRSKLMLIGVAVAGVLGLAYGAGLLLDHSDIPNGTTVLGVDIGGSTQDEAVSKLNAAVGDSAEAPLKLKVDGEEKTLKPSVAGLSLDTEATVRGVTGRDYNPISVIGSLVGGSREGQPAFTVDEDKLKSALQGLSSGSATDGYVKFENGKAVPVPGKAATAVDPERGSKALEDAYKQRAASGDDPVTTMPVSKQQPKVTEAEMQRAIKQYGEPAMSGWVWLRAGDVEVPFSEQSIGEFFQLKPKAGGSKLQPVVDQKALAAKYGGAFDGVVIDAGAGTVKMTPAHARAAVTKALGQTAPAGKRIAEVEGARSAG